MKPYRIMLTIAGHTRDLRFQAHDKDNDLLVVKSKHPEALDNLIVLTGIDPEIKERIKGHTNNIVVLTKTGAAKILAAAVTKLCTKADAFATAQANAGSDDDDTSDEPYADD